MMYTIVPPELIWDDDSLGDSGFVEVDVGGVHMLVQPGGLGRAKIVRLLSSDPNDYLLPQLQPGNEISLA